MSYYYTYYIGYKHDGKIYPLGPYNAKGELKSVINRSRSFASDLWEDFSFIKEEEISDELRKEFEYENWNGNKVFDIKYLPVKELPSDSYIKKGYFLIEDVQSYEKDGSCFDNFYDMLSPEVYTAKLQHELTFGKNIPKKDCEGEEYTEPNASDYMYYAYPDYLSKEYESFIIKEAAEMLKDYKLPKDTEYVVLLSEG